MINIFTLILTLISGATAFSLPAKKECRQSSDCAAASCCHPTEAVLVDDAPKCDGIMCSTECKGPLDCGIGKIECVEKACAIVSTIPVVEPQPQPDPSPSKARLDSKLEPMNVIKVDQIIDLMPSPKPGNNVNTIFTVRVISNGCTETGNFKVDLYEGKPAQLVKILKIIPDKCKKAPSEMEILLTSPKLKTTKPILVLNPQYVTVKTVH